MPAYSIIVERTRVEQGAIIVVADTPEEAQAHAIQRVRRLRRAGFFSKTKITARVLSTELQRPQTKEQSPD